MAEAEAEREARPKVRLVRPVVLIGLMGAGKSSVGLRLADALRAPFRDSDTEIEKAANPSVPDIFAKWGESEFRDGERKVIDRLLAGAPLVLATGGGAFMNNTTRAVIAERAVSVRARVSTATHRAPGRVRKVPRARIRDWTAAMRPSFDASGSDGFSTRKGSSPESSRPGSPLFVPPRSVALAIVRSGSWGGGSGVAEVRGASLPRPGSASLEAPSRMSRSSARMAQSSARLAEGPLTSEGGPVPNPRERRLSSCFHPTRDFSGRAVSRAIPALLDDSQV